MKISFLNRVTGWLGVILAAYFLVVLISLFFSGKMPYHDLSLVGDALSNTAYGRGFFLITDWGISHFRLQVTPTLLLLVPFYRGFDSQFVLVFVGWASLFGGIYFYLKIADRIFERTLHSSVFATLPQWFIKLIPVAFLFLMVGNRFTKNVVTAAHYETLYLLFWGWTVYELLINAPWSRLIPLWLLTIGVRSDASLYFGTQLLGLLLLNKQIADNPSRFRKKVLSLALLSFIYFVIIMEYIMPTYGSVDQVTRWWGHLGNSPSEITGFVLTHPRAMLTEVLHSGFIKLTYSFFFLPLLTPIYFFWTSLPGITQYLMLFPERKSLHYYHSWFLLPGMYVASAIGLVVLLNLGMRYRRLAYFIVLAIIPALLLAWKDTNNGYAFLPKAPTNLEFSKHLKQLLKDHPAVQNIATDVDHTVYIPNSKTIRTPRDYKSAELILLDPNAKNILTDRETMQDLVEDILNDPDFQVLEKFGNHTVFLRRG